MADRWATFDCYGTLIDWNGGIGRELVRLFGAATAARLLHRYHEVEPAVQADDPTRMYREVLDLALARLAATEGLRLPALDRFFELQDRPGLTNVMLGRLSLEEALVPIPVVDSNAASPSCTRRPSKG